MDENNAIVALPVKNESYLGCLGSGYFRIAMVSNLQMLLYMVMWRNLEYLENLGISWPLSTVAREPSIYMVLCSEYHKNHELATLVVYYYASIELKLGTEKELNGTRSDFFRICVPKYRNILDRYHLNCYPKVIGSGVIAFDNLLFAIYK